MFLPRGTITVLIESPFASAATERYAQSRRKQEESIPVDRSSVGQSTVCPAGTRCTWESRPRSCMSLVIDIPTRIYRRQIPVATNSRRSDLENLFKQQKARKRKYANVYLKDNFNVLYLSRCTICLRLKVRKMRENWYRKRIEFCSL